MSTEQGQRVPVPGSEDGDLRGESSGAPRQQEQQPPPPPPPVQPEATGPISEDALVIRLIERLAAMSVLAGRAGTQSAAPGGPQIPQQQANGTDQQEVGNDWDTGQWGQQWSGNGSWSWYGGWDDGK